MRPLLPYKNESNNGYNYLWRVLELTVPGFDPVISIKIPQWLDCNDIFQFSQAYLLYFCLQAKMHYHFTNRTRSGIFLCAIQYSDYADTVTTLQSHLNSYRKDYDTGFLPPHLILHGLAESIHLNAQACLQDVVSPQIRRLDFGQSLIQGLPPPTLHYPTINCLGCSKRTGVGFCDHDGGGGHPRGNRDGTCNGQNGFPCGPDPRTASGQSHTPQGPGHLARTDQNRHSFLPDIQCAACKQVGHVAKHCDMLATTICLEHYMKKDLLSTIWDAIEKDWLAKWKERLGNPDITPQQVMRAYIEELDITVAHLDDTMDWGCWDDNNYNQDPDYMSE
jgi:hypothetical protein